MRPRLRFLVASGPTQEAIDPVRFISNHSTGVMGKCLVQAAKKRGHYVEWVECPKRAQTALKLEKLLKKLTPKSDVLLMAAAVADVRPAGFSGAKIKKEKLHTIRLIKNPDVLAGLARRKKKGQVFIGFGLESADLVRNGKTKLRKKGLELIVLQKVTRTDKPFGDKAVDATLLSADGKVKKHAAISKMQLARVLVGQAEALFLRKCHCEPAKRAKQSML